MKIKIFELPPPTIPMYTIHRSYRWRISTILATSRCVALHLTGGALVALPHLALRVGLLQLDDLGRTGMEFRWHGPILVDSNEFKGSFYIAICRWIFSHKNGKTHSNKNLNFTLNKCGIFFHKLLYREFEQFQHGLHISQPTRPFRRNFIFVAHVGVLENDHRKRIEEKWTCIYCIGSMGLVYTPAFGSFLW